MINNNPCKPNFIFTRSKTLGPDHSSCQQKNQCQTNFYANALRIVYSLFIDGIDWSRPQLAPGFEVIM